VCDAGVPFFFKQWGGRNKKKAGRLLDAVHGSSFHQFPTNRELTGDAHPSVMSKSGWRHQNGVLVWIRILCVHACSTLERALRIGWASWRIIVIGTMHWPEKHIPSLYVRSRPRRRKQVRAVIEQYPGCERVTVVSIHGKRLLSAVQMTCTTGASHALLRHEPWIGCGRMDSGNLFCDVWHESRLILKTRISWRAGLDELMERATSNSVSGEHAEDF